MERYAYDADSLASALVEFEGRYGCTSADFYEGYLDDGVADVPRFTQHLWASFYRDHCRLRDGVEQGVLVPVFAR